jgi:hypothetical protein
MVRKSSNRAPAAHAAPPRLGLPVCSAAFPKASHFFRLASKMSRNTHAPTLPANGQLTPPRYAEHAMDETTTNKIWHFTTERI